MVSKKIDHLINAQDTHDKINEIIDVVNELAEIILGDTLMEEGDDN